MKVNAITIRPGNVLDRNGKLMLVTKIDIIQPGKGNAVIQVEMKDVRTGTQTQDRFRTQETVERARLDEAEMPFLYSEGDNFTFMETENFEQKNGRASLRKKGVALRGTPGRRRT